LLDNGQNGADLALGFELSIYLMLGAPLLILATLAGVFYWQIQSAKKLGSYPDAARIIERAESRALPPASL
jgi:CHASE3 domain sensor protein